VCVCVICASVCVCWMMERYKSLDSVGGVCVVRMCVYVCVLVMMIVIGYAIVVVEIYNTHTT